MVKILGFILIRLAIGSMNTLSCGRNLLSIVVNYKFKQIKVWMKEIDLKLYHLKYAKLLKLSVKMNSVKYKIILR